jgi:hypothetical protein
MKKLLMPKKALLFTGVILLVLLAGAPSLYFYNKYQQEVNKSAPQAAEEELRATKAKVGKLIALPKNEEPVLATVSDTQQLKDQPFFANSQNGDKVLIYPKARKAYLYRPSLNKLIEVATVNLDSGLSQEIRIALRNGSGSAGLTNRIEPEITKAAPNANIVRKENAARSNYEETLVIDITGENTEASEQIARVLGASKSSLPRDEKAPPDTDILIILGRDFADK